MKPIKPITAMKQPLLWRQAISQSKFGKLNWKNFYYYPLTKWAFSFKKHESALFDYVIIGSNPIITHLLILKLFKEISFTDQAINIGIYFTGNDYWSYHLFENKETWDFLSKEMDIDLGESFAESLIKHKNVYRSIGNITLINSHNNCISYYQKDEQYSKGYIIHLKPQQYEPNTFEKAMPHVNVAENQLRLKYLDSYYSFFDKTSETSDNIFKLSYSNKMQANQDSEEKTHILLSNRIFLTSLAYWLNSNPAQEHVKNYENNIYHSTYFEHKLNQYSYGTANRTANDFGSLEHQSLEDCKYAFKEDH